MFTRDKAAAMDSKAHVRRGRSARPQVSHRTVTGRMLGGGGVVVRIREAAVVMALLAAAAAPLRSQSSPAPDSSLLSLDRIYHSREFAPERYDVGSWLPDGSGYLRVERRDGRDEIVAHIASNDARTVVVSSDRLVPPGSSEPLAVASFSWSGDGTSAGSTYLLATRSPADSARRAPEDYWTLTLGTWQLRQLGGADATRLTRPQLSPDGRQVAYVVGHDLYVEDLATDRVHRLTTDGSSTLFNGTAAGLDVELSTRGFWWSPDGKRIAFVQFDGTGVRKFRIIDYTDSLFSTVRSYSYVHPGDPMPAARVGIVDASGGDSTVWVDLPGSPRDHYITAVDWTPGSDALMVTQLNRRQDTVRVFMAEPSTGMARRILFEADSTWLELHPTRWLDGGRSFTWVSERDGWRHAYRISRDGTKVDLLTPGAFDILSIEGVDEQHGWLYFIASPDNPTQRYLYRASLDGSGHVERVTPRNEQGTNSYDIAPGAAWAWHTFSTFQKPPKVDLVSLPAHRSVRTVVDNAALAARVAELKKGQEGFFRIDIGHGVTLDGWAMKPYDFDAGKKYPVLFYVYGMPAAQTVLDRWGGNRYLFHLLLTQLGYVVMSVDNRGTPAPRGRAWRKVIYLKHGLLPSQDQAAAVRALEKRWSWMDASEIGIYGWSGGGNVSMNAIFRNPDVYSVAMPGAGISNFMFYHAGWIERFLGLPSDHPEAYKTVAPINVAKNLRGHLLIIQGTGDTNVHFQSSAALENALIAAGKRFSIMPYPNRNHDMREGRNTQWDLHDLYIWYMERNMPSQRNHLPVAEPSSRGRNHEP